MSHHTWTLDNGLNVIGESQDHMKSVAVGFFVKTGSRDEPMELNGVSHFLEHMMFKGTHKRTGAEVDEDFDSLGAEYNAFTGYEYTGYYGRTLPEHLEALVELLADMMQPALRQDDFDTEKQVILEEIALYEDRPQSVLQRQAVLAYYGDHPLGQEILGSNESITAMTRDQMHDYFQKHYVPHNITLTVAGNFEPEQLLALAEKYCAAWKSHPVERQYDDFAPKANEVKLTRSNVNRLHAVTLSPAPAYQDPRNEAMDLMIDILGHPGNSRLHWALVDKGLVDYAGASYHAQDQLGVMGVSLSCDPQKIDDVMAIVQAEIQTLIEQGISEKELDSARNRVLTSLATEGEQSLRRLFSFAFDALYSEPYRSVGDVLAAYEKVTVDDIHQLLKEYPFSPQTTVSLGPA